MNHNTFGRGQSRGTFGGRTRPGRGSRRHRRGNRLPGVLLSSLGLATLGVAVMWSEAATARGAHRPGKHPTRTPSPTLVSTVTSVAPVLPDSVDSGRHSKFATPVMPVTILAIEPVAFGQTAQSKTRRRGDAKPGPAAKPRGRLPKYFGKVGVSATQKQRIYSIQAMYRKRIEALNRQLEDLRSRERKEVLEALTPLQKQRLSELIRMAELARKARLRARKQRKSSPKPPVTPKSGGPGIR